MSPSAEAVERTPVAVIGASLAGLAVAARLALAGHRVIIHERASAPALTLPPVLDLPAAWRDTFRKSGRPLDLELDRAGLSWTPAPPTDHGALALPHDRAGQYAAISAAAGPATAQAWQDFLDRTDDTWQRLRPLGLEQEFRARRPDRATRRAIGWRHSLADHARELGHPLLGDLLGAVAAEQHTTADRLPGWYATRHALRRTFGRWTITDATGTPDNAALVRLLLARLDKRGVELRHGSEIPDPARLDPVELGAAAVVDTTGGDRIAWRGRRTWQRLTPTTRSPGRYYAGPLTRAGTEPWAQLLSAALAAYAVHRDRTGEDIRPTRKDTPRRRLI
ncbi:phytoene dehydrogenase-like protein [Naumannella cuiyingiana]|uniref:Phytoene dehydrogenase-like protein n=1 Tax=Naumannella cuiyingiana TaxID=1347891 RepID=A0A7Z0DB49_9ACTN|nr:hypothetical protein [Naumannella cuiyingiana]NYI72075.1 phytoene dehydrogenase-like protein [Naumannella cuiyingiana]